MKILLRRPETRALSWALGAALLAPAMLAAQGRIRGRISNGTTKRPVAGQAIQLLMPRQGMQLVATATSDGEGNYALTAGSIDPNGFYLLQAVHDGVNYHSPVQFDAQGSALVDLTVYDSVSTAPDLRIKSARIVIRAEAARVRVQELFGVENASQPPRTYRNPDGTLRFRLAPGSSEPTVAVAGLMGMPLPQSAQPGASAGDYSIAYPLKPGLTVFMVAHDEDYSSGQFALGDSVLYPIEQAELDVVPASLMAESSLFRPAGQDADTGGQKFVAENLHSATPLEVKVSGEASAEAASPESGQPEGEVRSQPNSMTALGMPLLACFMLILLWALGVRVTKEWRGWKAQQGSSLRRKEFEGMVEVLFNSLTDLDELFAAGKIPKKKYWKDRLELKAKLVATLKKGPPSLLESYATRRPER